MNCLWQQWKYRKILNKIESYFRRIYQVEDPWSSQLIAEDLFSIFKPILEQWAKSLPDDKRYILDIGGGEGTYVNYMQPYFTHYHLIDIDPTAIKRAKGLDPQYREYKVERKGLHELYFRQPGYHLIYINSVLHYQLWGEFQKVANKISRHLVAGIKPGGAILLVHPFHNGEEERRLEEHVDRFKNLGMYVGWSQRVHVAGQVWWMNFLRKPQ